MLRSILRSRGLSGAPGAPRSEPVRSATGRPPSTCTRGRLLASVPLILLTLSAAVLYLDGRYNDNGSQPFPPSSLPAPDDEVASFVPPPSRALEGAEGEPCGGGSGVGERERALACEAWCSTSAPLVAFAAQFTTQRSCKAAAPSPAGGALALMWRLVQSAGLAHAAPVESEATPAAGRRPLVLYTGYNGLADSLVGALSAFYIAFLTGADFYMRFSDRPSDPSFLWAYDPGCMDALGAEWTLSLPPEASPIEQGDGVQWPLVGRATDPRAPRAPGGEQGLPTSHYGFDAFHVPEAFLGTLTAGNLTDLWKGRPVLSLQTHLGIIHHLIENPHYRRRLRGLGLTLQNAYAHAYHFLLRPRRLGLSRYARELTAMQSNSTLRIAIHVRVGVHHDGAFLAAAPEAPPAPLVQRFSPFFSCAEEVEGQLMGLLGRKRVLWYLISDSMGLREEAQVAWPDKVLTRTSELALAHSRSSLLGPLVQSNSTCTSFLDSAMEHWLFGLADAHVISQWSGFGRTGSLVHVTSHLRKPVFQVYPLNPAQVSCALGSTASIKDVSSHVPGI